MRLMLSFILAVVLAAPCFGQALRLEGRVVDAETGEPLPFCTISKGNGRGTLTNAEGCFRLVADGQDVLTFRFIGFAEQSLRARDVPPVVSMKPSASILREVEVSPIDTEDILRQVIENMKKDYRSHSRDQRTYFMRTMLTGEWDSYLIESFMRARSAINIRYAETLSGVYGMSADGRLSNMTVVYTNIHYLLGIGPLTKQSRYWGETVKPLVSLKQVRQFYDVGIATMDDGKGQPIYRITFRGNGQSAGKAKEKRLLSGTAYVDSRTMRPVRFEGEVENAHQWVDFVRRPSTIRFSIDYDQADGYTAVTSLSIDGGNDKMRYRMVVMRLPDDDGLEELEGHTGENIILVLEEAGRGAPLWERYDLIRRTAEEESIAIGKKQ